ncbi:uncharacterized protein HD556DRAFT_1442292 [Suillus plorans]|uniref:Uncharacterized protein n=1 Tax=Suillus plorans TaxID=116603 RepID=A0A9P7DJF5_9AGAM|nr:uncharacterized protein HD556DRAFT_1442292 [Suillus plorans]KAG1795440.1 hypothetical protein HD556DRAFT_1442292 [Suillus plorans]
MPAVTTRSGRHIRHPPLPDQHKTRRKASNADNVEASLALEPPKRSCPRPRRRTGPKSVIDHSDDHPELSIRPPPKPCPLARSKCLGPMTSSAEEEIFEASFSRRSSMIPANSDVAIDQQSHPSHVQLADGTSLTRAEFCLLADEEVSADIQEGDVESGKHFIMLLHPLLENTPLLRVRIRMLSLKVRQTISMVGISTNSNVATCTESHDAGYSNKDHGKDTSGTSTESHYPEEGGNDDGHKTSATSTNSRPHRSGGVKSYAPDRSAGEDDEAPSEADPPSPPEDEDDEDFVKTKGRMPQVGILKAQELGKKTLEATRTLGQEYGKSAQTILIEAGLTMKATRKESPWNQHQTWFTATHPLPKGVSGVVSPEDVKAWKVKQRAHYKAHPQDDPQHASLWKEIQENWDRAVAGTTEDLTSRSAAGLMMGVCDAFTKSAAYWHRTHGIHIAGVAIFPSDEEAGRQASGLFAGSDMVKALINSHQLDIKCWLDELTTILKYKDLEAAHAEGKTFSLLPASSTAPNGSLLRNGKPARDRNRKLTMLDILYTEKLCIHDWPAGVPPPGPDFDLKALSTSQLHALVAPYLRLHLGAMYEAELGLDNDNDDSEAEAAKAKKRKGKSKKSGDKGRKKGAVVEEPSVILHISRWPESDILTVETQATSMCLIPLVIDTNGKVVRSLQDSEKFIKDLLQDDTQDDTPRRRTKQVIKKPAVSNLTASRSTMGASRSNQEASHSTMGASRSNQEASHSTMGASRSNQEASRSTMGASHSNQEASRSHRHTNRAIYDNFPPSSPPTPSSQFSSPPPISRASTPMSTWGYPHVGDATYPSRSRYEHSHDGPRRYQRAFDDAMPTYNPDTRKRTRPHYESARETEDLERETVEERHRVRVHENSRIPLGRAQSQARVSSAPISSTSRSRLLSHSSVVPTSCTGSSQRRNHSTVRPSHIHPASPDRCAIIEEDEDEYY